MWLLLYETTSKNSISGTAKRSLLAFEAPQSGMV